MGDVRRLKRYWTVQRRRQGDDGDILKWVVCDGCGSNGVVVASPACAQPVRNDGRWHVLGCV